MTMVFDMSVFSPKAKRVFEEVVLRHKENHEMLRIKFELQNENWRQKKTNKSDSSR